MLAAVLELAPSGVEQVAGHGYVEYAVYGAPGELPELDEGEAEVGGVLVTVSGTEVPDDWAERWKRFHSPVLVGGRLWVRPPWEEPAVQPGVIDVVIDPGRAFGTGAHPTTRLCLELLLELELEGRSFCDLGCGSGVLSIAAAKLGAGPVTALDSDRLAVDATLANARDNGVVPEEVRRANLRSEVPPAADVVAANLMRPLLLRVAGLMGDPPAALIVSGLLEHEGDEVAAAFGRLELSERRRLTSRGWTAVLLSGSPMTVPSDAPAPCSRDQGAGDASGRACTVVASAPWWPLYRDNLLTYDGFATAPAYALVPITTGLAAVGLRSPADGAVGAPGGGAYTLRP